MKKNSLLLVAVLLFITGTVNAQHLISSLGGIKTHYTFYSDTIALHVSEQFIIKNAGSYSYGGPNSGLAAGYESYHLEFVTTKDLKRKDIYVHPTTSSYQLEFYDADNHLLSTTTLKQDRVSKYTNKNKKGSPVFYSLDLFELPISLLDKTAKINILELGE